MSSEALFQPFQMHDLKLRNRIALAPMTRGRAGVARVPNASMAKYYSQRSSAGLIITEATTISEQANGWNESPGIYTEAMQEGWKPVVDTIHQHGGVVFLQLWHMGRSSHSDFHNGAPAVAPSAIAIQGDGIHTPKGKKPYEVPRALATEEIPLVVREYEQAARRAKAAGFDGVEIHGANGYLIDEFLQSKSNQRTDRYGGSVENRYQFLKEIVEAITSVWSPTRVGVRLSPNGVYNDMGSPDFREQFTYVASQLDQYKLAYLHVMDGLAFGFHQLGEPMTLDDFRRVFHGALIGNCGYTQEAADKAVAGGHADLIAFGRPFISNPDLVERFKNGWPLSDIAPMTDWYSPTGEKGYTDFPAHSTEAV